MNSEDQARRFIEARKEYKRKKAAGIRTNWSHEPFSRITRALMHEQPGITSTEATALANELIKRLEGEYDRAT